MATLTEIDSLEVLVIIDNELDPVLKYAQPPSVEAYGNIGQIGMASPHRPQNRGADCHEMKMEQVCCGAHGLSLMVTGTKGEARRTVLFDTGPEEAIWEMNAKRLKPDLAAIDLIMLSHWHRDHSGGMLRAVKSINAAREQAQKTGAVTVDLHPDRPDFRGFQAPDFPVSLEADPTFLEIEDAGATVEKNGFTHTVLDDMFLISGEIPRTTGYELGIRRGIRFDIEKKAWEQDTLIKDERFLMCKLKGRGLVLFTGCSHAGVVNASRHGVELGQGTPLYAVMGGYHLADAETAQIEQTVKDLKVFKPHIMLPGHCSGWKVKYQIEKEMPGTLAPSTVGTRFTFV